MKHTEHPCVAILQKTANLRKKCTSVQSSPAHCQGTPRCLHCDKANQDTTRNRSTPASQSNQPIHNTQSASSVSRTPGALTCVAKQIITGTPNSQCSVRETPSQRCKTRRSSEDKPNRMATRSRPAPGKEQKRKETGKETKTRMKTRTTTHETKIYMP